MRFRARSAADGPSAAFGFGGGSQSVADLHPQCRAYGDRPAAAGNRDLVAGSVSAEAQGPLWTFRDVKAPPNNQLGFHVDRIGEYNIDAVPGVLPGAPGDVGTQPAFTYGGAAWIMDGATGATLATFYGAARDMRLGIHGVGVPGTVNGSVLVIGAPGSPPASSSDGSVLVYPFNAPIANPFVISKALDANGNSDGFGSEVAAVGD